MIVAGRAVTGDGGIRTACDHIYGLSRPVSLTRLSISFKPRRRGRDTEMEGSDRRDEESNDEFQCFVCLDLIYKPVVLECGHVSCFWCVQKAMNSYRDSSCAICRQPYKHFPAICHLLHCLLLKIKPKAYKQREAEVLEDEKRRDCFSPQLIEYSSDCKQVLGFESTQSEVFKEKAVLISDVLCSGCKGLLFMPGVLNCGHVFCGSCMSGLTSEEIKCPTCESSHPGSLPKTCLDLDQFIEKQFPVEYAKRRDSFEPKEMRLQNDGSSSSALSKDQLCKKKSISIQLAHKIEYLEEEYWNAHIGVGCDSCGVYPISGKRYRCKDCKETIGFDLCETCYETPSKRPGRFNQQHTPDHEFMLDDSTSLLNMLKQQFHELGELSSAELDDT